MPQPGRLHLSAEYIDRNGAYLLDAGCVIYVYIRGGISPQWVNDVIGVPSFAAIPQPLYEESLPFVDNATSELARNFVAYLQKNKPFPVPVQIIRWVYTRFSFLVLLIFYGISDVIFMVMFEYMQSNHFKSIPLILHMSNFGVGLLSF